MVSVKTKTCYIESTGRLFNLLRTVIFCILNVNPRRINLIIIEFFTNLNNR